MNQFFNKERLIHSFKTAVACLLALLLSKLIGLASDQWIIVTIIVVMGSQIYVGSVLQRAYLRFLGTMLGCLVATLALDFFGHTTLIIAATIGFATFVFSYLATSRESLTYAGTLGAVTTTIIMLGRPPSDLLALERFLEISMGLAISTLVSQFVLPIHARVHLKRAQAITLQQLKKFYSIALGITPAEGTSANELDEVIVQSILKQRQLAKDCVREPKKFTFDPGIFSKTLQSEKEVLRAISFMHNALLNLKTPLSIFNETAAFKTFNHDVLSSIDILIKKLEVEDPHLHTIASLSIESLKNTIEELKTPQDDWLYIEGFLFSAEILVKNLTELDILFRAPLIEIE